MVCCHYTERSMTLPSHHVLAGVNFECFKCHDRAQLFVMSPPPLDLSLVFPASMSTSTTQDEQSPSSSRKCTCSSALKLGPQKKLYIILTSNVLIAILLCTRTSQDPLVHHRHHFGRAVHAFCNVQTLVMNGLQAMCDDAPEDKSLMAVCIPYATSLSRQILTSVQQTQGACCFLRAASISARLGESTHVILRGRSDCDSRSGVFYYQ